MGGYRQVHFQFGKAVQYAKGSLLRRSKRCSYSAKQRAPIIADELTECHLSLIMP